MKRPNKIFFCKNLAPVDSSPKNSTTRVTQTYLLKQRSILTHKLSLNTLICYVAKSILCIRIESSKYVEHSSYKLRTYDGCYITVIVFPLHYLFTYLTSECLILHTYLKFIYSENATKFYEISTVDMSYVVPVKSTVEISQNFVAFSEYLNFTKFLSCFIIV